MSRDEAKQILYTIMNIEIIDKEFVEDLEKVTDAICNDSFDEKCCYSSYNCAESYQGCNFLADS